MKGRADEPTSEPGVYKRGNRYVVRYRDPQGRRRRRAARTFQEARDLKSALRTDVRRGEYREVSRETFASYAGEWLDTYAGRTGNGIRPATLADYRSTMERDAIPFLGRQRMSEIEPRDIRRLQAHVRGRGVSWNTVRLALAPVKACFATALEDGVIRANPCTGIRTPREERFDAESDDQVKALTEADLQLFLEHVDQAWRPLFEVLVQTGLRISEALALQWRDVDFGQKRLAVRRRLYKGTIAAPKSRYGRRDIPLSAGTAQLLWQQRKVASAAGGTDPVFATRTGELHDRNNVYTRILVPARKAAGVPWVGFHTFRHTCATRLFRHGLNAKQVQLWLGHHSPAFTLATYVHLVPEDLPSADFLDALPALADGGPHGGPRPTEMSRDREAAGEAESTVLRAFPS